MNDEKHYLFTSAEPEEAGEIFVYDRSLDNLYDSGMPVYLAAQPKPGWKFSHWHINNWAPVWRQELVLPVMEDRAASAHFVRKNWLLRFLRL